MSRFIIFITIALSIYALMNITAFYWLRFMFRPAGVTKYFFVVTFWVLAGAIVAGRILESSKGGSAAAAVLNTGYIWLGFLFYFFLFGIITGLLVQMAALLRKTGWVQVSDEWIRTGFPVTGAVIIGVLIVFALSGLNSVRKPFITKFNIAVASMAFGSQPLTIVQLSDLHLDSMKSVAWWERIVDRTNALQPDVIVLTGDIIDESPEELGGFVPGLKRLSTESGVYGVTGNHEFYIGTPGAMKLLQDCGVTILRNQIHVIPGVLCLVGIDDPTGIGVSRMPPPDFGSLSRMIPDNLPVVVMNHQPVYIDAIEALGADLQLSGHTHNGQIWPFKWINRLVFRYQNGLHYIGGLTLYVSSGTGTWGPPFRIGTRSEIVVFQLHPVSPGAHPEIAGTITPQTR